MPQAAGTQGSGGTAASDTATQQLRAEVPTTASLAAVRKGLPAGPIDAVDALVGTVFGPDEKAAVAATAELLRRAGLPLVSADQPILELPDQNMIVNHQIPVEMIPSLTDAVRSGQHYTLDQSAQLLTLADATTKDLTGAQLVATLARWGKTPDAPPESVAAAAAVRALGVWHHQLLNSNTVVTAAAEKQARADLMHAPPDTLAALTDPERVTGLDPLQVLLLLAHATAYAATVADVQAAAPGLRRNGVALQHADAGAPHSNAVCSFLDFSDTFGGKVDHGIEKNAFRQTLIQGAKLVLKAGKAVAKVLGKVFVGYDVASDVLTTVLLFTGLKTTISFDKATTHFRHRPHDGLRNVKLMATITFHSALQGKNGQYHGCWRFAGVKMPQNGGVKDWLVHWDIDGPVVVLRKVALAPVPAMGDGPSDMGAPTDANGQSWIEVGPRTEKKPPPAGQEDSAPQHVMVNQVTAEPDPHLSLVEPADIFNLGAILVNPLAPVILEVEKMINRAVRNHLLPETTVPYPVSYHLMEPFTVRTDGFLTLLFYGKLRVSTDLYSCYGAGGPWEGTATFSVTAGAGTKALERMFGVHAKDSGHATVPLSFTLDTHSGARKQIHIPTESGDLGLWLQLDPDAVQRFNHPPKNGPAPSPVVGNGTWTVGGQDVTLVSQLLGPAFSNGLKLPVIAKPLDSRCSGGTLADDPFDQD